VDGLDRLDKSQAWSDISLNFERDNAVPVHVQYFVQAVYRLTVIEDLKGTVSRDFEKPNNLRASVSAPNGF
jgi:hypothetical protein